MPDQDTQGNVTKATQSPQATREHEFRSVPDRLWRMDKFLRHAIFCLSILEIVHEQGFDGVPASRKRYR
jgi:hypothetical protein